MKQVCGSTDFHDRSLKKIIEFSYERDTGGRREAFDLVCKQTGDDEVLSRTVVQISCNASAFLVLCLQQRAGKLSRRFSCPAEFIDCGAKQEHGNGDTHQKDL